MLQSQPNIQMAAIFDLIYPVGSLYFSTSLDTVAKVQSAFGGTWEKLPDGYAIWTAASDAGNTIAPGLPNIKGWFPGGDTAPDGVLFKDKGKNSSPVGGGSARFHDYGFNANEYNKIYQDGITTVQPPAYKVYAYRRTALRGGGLKVIFASIMLALKRSKVIC